MIPNKPALLASSYNAGLRGDTVYFGNPNPNRAPQLKKTHSSGRNDPCPCGSGKKFKHCHWRRRTR